jgi:hypothetical protein
MTTGGRCRPRSEQLEQRCARQVQHYGSADAHGRLVMLACACSPRSLLGARPIPL